MYRPRLNDGAITLSKLLDEAHIKHGMFRGYAIGAFGGPRETKDIDCIVATTKPALIQLLNGKSGFVCVPQTRTDYVAFLWSDQADPRRPVLVEVFVEQFEGMSVSLAGTSFVDLTRLLLHYGRHCHS
ncbi:hypothetical protein PV04_08840 [Phialophora macrospora]|uniref:Polymerase nucleotidyl transferase domain-containing protein n=1 Tax=Phialophora macrospora TaxID=1851006 RepID=A0A0D2F7A3_9EURO|nr:hypothetical protein PV04_08840 [Phialophora macrospora]